MDREDGMVRERPAVLLLKHLHECWPTGEAFLPTATLIASLAASYPQDWGMGSPFGRPLTSQRLGRMLATSYGINSTRLDRVGPRGYTWAALLPVWRRMGMVRDDRQRAPVHQSPAKQTGASGAGGASGAVPLIEPTEPTGPTEPTAAPSPQTRETSETRETPRHDEVEQEFTR